MTGDIVRPDRVEAPYPVAIDTARSRHDTAAIGRAAQQAAATAQKQVGIRVAAMSSAAGAHEAAHLLAEIWGTGDSTPPISPHLVMALAHAGNYVAGAWAGQTLVGASVGFLGLDAGSITLHSHITGVARRAQGGQVGWVLKLHQRAWALERGIAEIGWSFDPLVRRNAWFNLMKLRAVAVSFHRDFYGPMHDGINAGDESDRCLVRWDLRAPDVVAACQARQSEADTHGLVRLARGGTLLLDQGPDGDPVAHPFAPADNAVWLCRVPGDIEHQRRSAPARAQAWRLALRQTMGAAMDAGFVARGLTRDGCYVLTRPGTTPEEGPRE
jgi:predicted GNAT superfamily acetyltransferase